MKHKYLVCMPVDRWERLKRDAKKRGVSYNVVINDALDNFHMTYLYGPGLFEDTNFWHDSKKETPDSNTWLVFALKRKNKPTDYYIGTYNKQNGEYYYMDTKHTARPDYWMYIPELIGDED